MPAPELATVQQDGPPRPRFECGCCLYGLYSAIPFALGTTATVLIWIVTFDCRYFRTNNFSFIDSAKGVIGLKSSSSRTFTVGPWLVEQFYPDNEQPLDDEGECVLWSSHATLSMDDLDATLTFGRAVSLFTSLGALLVGLLYAMMFCMTMDRRVLKFLALSAMLFAVCSFLTVMMITSDTFCESASDCVLKQDGFVAIGATLAWLATGAVLLCYMPEPAESQSSAQQQQRQHEQQPQEACRGGTAATTITTSTTTAQDGTVLAVTTTTTTNEGVQSVADSRETEPPAAEVASTSAIAVADGDPPLVDAIPIKGE